MWTVTLVGCRFVIWCHLLRCVVLCCAVLSLCVCICFLRVFLFLLTVLDPFNQPYLYLSHTSPLLYTIPSSHAMQCVNCRLRQDHRSASNRLLRSQQRIKRPRQVCILLTNIPIINQSSISLDQYAGRFGSYSAHIHPVL